MAQTSSANLERAFADTQSALMDVQTKLSKLQARAASDPWWEHLDEARLTKLQGQRDQLLMMLGRQALSWTLRGGSVRLDGEVHAPELPAPATDTPGDQDDDDGPVVISRSRPVRRVFDPSASSAPEVVSVRGRSPRAEAARDVDHARLTELLRMLGEPTMPLDSIERVRDELSRLGSGTTISRLEEWATFPKPVQKALVGMCVARARHLQDEVEAGLIPLELTGDLDRIFSTMTGYSKREQPGFVFGLQRHHHPMGVTWLADARRWWTDLIDFLPEPSVLSPERALAELRRRIKAGVDAESVLTQAAVALDAGLDATDPRLVTMMIPYAEALKAEAKYKHLRKAMRELLTQDEEADAELADPDTSLPQDWTGEGAVEGREVAMVGGPVPEVARKRLAEIFGWADAEWVDGDHPRALEDLAEKVRDDRFDLVVVLRRFVGDDADRVLIPVCDEEGVLVADVFQSYGATAIREAIEDALEEFDEFEDEE